jgi:cytochrome b pre-mRNA-processing protein 3
MLRSLKRRAEFQRKAGEIYGAIVTQARQPVFYARLGIPDTPTGRYEMVVIHLFLVLERLRGEGASGEPVAQELVDAFVADMDDSLRELGTGDIGVPRRVKRAAAGFYQRSKDYREAIGAGGRALELALARYLRGPDPGEPRIAALAEYVRAAMASLAGQQAVEVIGGGFSFPDPSALAMAEP